MPTADPEGRAGDQNAVGSSSDALESVAFLARSEHRLYVLERLNEGTCTRDRLNEELGVTRVTLSRILGDLEDRGWITKNLAENEYALTSFGELVYGDFGRLLGTVSVGRKYPDVVERLPTEWFDFDLRRLADSELVADESTDPLAAARVVANAVRDASSCRSLLGTFISLPMYTYEEAVRTGTEPDATVVFDCQVAETMLGEPDLLNRWQEIEATTGSVVYYSVDERVPCSIDLVDGETVYLTVDRERESGFDIIRCSHPSVVEWGSEVIGTYREGATPLGQRAGDGGT